MTDENSGHESESRIKPPSFLDALVVILALIILLAGAVTLFGSDAITGPVQIALILSAMAAMLIGLKNGHRWADMGKAAVEGISTAMGAIFILLAVGALIGTWSMSGTVVTLVYYGVSLLSPTWYYIACVIICALVALSIGSSWTVAATLGVSLVAVAGVIGVSPEITAGAVISGAYFGDKLSPLSETTNLAPAVAGTDIFTHIKNMLSTTLPAILIALVIFGFIGFTQPPTSAEFDVSRVLEIITSVFNVNLWTLLPLLVVLIMALRKMPAFPTVLVGALLGGIMAVILQPHLVLSFVNEPDLSQPVAMIKGVWAALATGFALETGYPGLDALISRGGMASMLETVWLIISAMAFGGVMEYSGLLARLMQPLLERAQTAKSMLISVGLTAIGLNIIAGDQYMAIVLPGKLFAAEFRKKGIAPETLSRQIEDTATITSPLVPWNSCGAYMAATLGIATFAYLPYCFFNLINPLLSFIYDIAGFQIKRIEPEEPVPEPLTEGTFYGVGGQRVEPTKLAKGPLPEQVLRSDVNFSG